MSAVLIPDAPAPGTAEWLQYMTGSKIAAVMRLSPYESAYSLWHRMAGIIPPEEPSEQMRRGHYLEPSILAWLADQNPGIEFGVRGSMWASVEHPAYAITPDALGTDRATGDQVLIEAKSALDKDVWGDELSDEIPVYYRCQVMWGMGILGIRRALVGVLSSYLDFREYEVLFDETEFALLVEAATAFMASLATREAPDIDSHSATYEVIREMHPAIDTGISIDLPADLAHGYVAAKLACKSAEDDARLWTAKLADHMGNAKTARYGGRIIATRQVRGEAVPFVQAARGLQPLVTISEEF